ncbi:MAG: hypothetical protein K2X81_24115, partial [Candidatus Obscuribacterales bacterium]|nr:hypothetical protein [Candidatus Obscuribacterales bacterium]
MPKKNIHQLLHGYRHGHELLASSLKLNKQQSDLVRRLSDLSGMLPEKFQVSPYYCGYALPDSEYYVFAKTWLDEDATRAGCVLTHSLLVPVEQWLGFAPEAVTTLFRKPSNDYAEYRTPLSLKESDSYLDIDSTSFDESSVNDFLSKYFVQGVKPIVWMDAPNVDQFCWRLIRSLWPELRKKFGFCTLSLQPRNESEGTFDVYFAPITVLSRFQKLKRENVIGKTQSKDLPAWLVAWKAYLLNETPLSDDEMQLLRLLSSDPCDLGKIFLYSELLDRAEDSPSALLGALDVLESIGPESSTCLVQKEMVVSKAVDVFSSVSLSDAGEALSLFALLDTRL